MFEWLTEPRTLILLAALAVLTVLFGRLRRKSRTFIAMDTIGIVAAWTGAFWASALGQAAIGAVALVVVGVYLVTTAHERDRASKRASREAESPA